MKNKGFTLTEMSIVLVIIALILSAIMKGQSLVEEAKLQAVVAEVSQYKVAIAGFYSKYGKYPGDFNEAVINWGATANADGNNNGQIEFKNSSSVYEGYRAWQQLTYAGMVTAAFSAAATTSAATIGKDIPDSKINSAGYFLDYSSSASSYDASTGNQYGILFKNVMIFGTPDSTDATTVSPVKVKGILTPNQAFSIDTKVDDGSPTSGSVEGADGKGATTGNCVASAAYVITLSGKDCIMVFRAND